VVLQVRARPGFLGVQRQRDGAFLVAQEIDEGFGLDGRGIRDLGHALEGAIAHGAVVAPGLRQRRQQHGQENEEAHLEARIAKAPILTLGIKQSLATEIARRLVAPSPPGVPRAGQPRAARASFAAGTLRAGAGSQKRRLGKRYFANVQAGTTAAGFMKAPSAARMQPPTMGPPTRSPP
jgi:hypothetical protein